MNANDTKTPQALSAITAIKVTSTVLSGRTYSIISYKMGGSWHDYTRPYKDAKDARRVAKSILDSQSFNLSTTGGI